MRIAPFVPPAIITCMMFIGLFITVTFQNEVPTATQEAIAAQSMPFMTMSTSGNLKLSFGAFLLATLIADLALFVPLYLMGRRGR